jgi:hypothetical protein
MRSREEIEEGIGINEATKKPLTVGGITYFQSVEDATLEVLLDIRDLLANRTDR